MADLLKRTFVGFFCDDVGSIPVFQPLTQTCMADPLTTKLEVRRTLGCLTTHNDTGPDMLFLMVLKALSYDITPVFTRMFNALLATKKPMECFFYLKRSFATLTTSMFLPLYKARNCRHSPPFSPGIPRRQKAFKSLQ